jgi:LPPG:FO 2-phospho-L-lactate transferase
MGMGTVVALGAQVGGAKLADGLYRLRGKDLAVIVNTGDDCEHLGLALSPDIDTMLYTLAGLADPARGWEPAGETFSFFDTLKRLGGPDWLRVGDRGLAAAVLRAEGLGAERRLTEITLDFCRQLDIAARVLPMSDDPVRTLVRTEEGEMSFNEYFFQLQCVPAVESFHYAGADRAELSDEVIDALLSPDLEAVVICPSNPYHAIRPILEVQGMRELLRKRGAPIVAVSPIVGSRALKGSAAKMMREMGREVSARGVAIEYYRQIDGFVIDTEDEALAEGIRASGIDVLVTPTVMRTPEDCKALAQGVLDFAQVVRERKAAQEA